MENKILKNDEQSFLSLSQQREKTDRMNRFFAQAIGDEDVSRREASVKHFDMGANRYQAVVYSEPVHFRNSENDEWQEIDNTLEEYTTAQGRQVFRNRANRVRVEFPREADGGSMASVTASGKTFSWRFENEVQPTRARIRTGLELKQERLVKMAQKLPMFVGRTLESLQMSDLEAELETEQEKRADIANLRAQNRYDEVLPGVSVRYTLNGESVKEDIILANAQALAHASLRLPADFAYEVTEAQQLRVLDKATGEEQFSMSTPVVYDAEGKETIAQVVLTDCGGYVRMTYAIDPAFMAEAAYPVTIDPVVQTATTNEAVCDAYIWAKNPDTNYGSIHLMRCGDGSGGESISLVKFNKLIKIKASDTILSAQLRVTAYDYPSNPEIMGCYPIKTDWTESGVTWNKMTPANDTHISKDLIAYIPATNPAYCYFDITSQYRDWYMKNADGSSRNYGVALRRPPEVTSGGNYVEWVTTQYDSSRGPCMVVNYISHAGRKDWWQYEQMSAGRAGTAYVDLYNGNLVYEHEDGGTTGNRMPVGIKHVYNSCLSETNPAYCGKGWRTSMHQSVCKKSLGGTSYYIWTDGDATEHYFKISGTQPYEDMEGMSLKLSTSGGNLTITDKEHVKLTFPLPADTTQQYLTKISDSMGNRAELTYVNGKLSTIKDGVDRAIQFSYNSAGNLSQMTIPGRPTLTFDYTGDNLTGISYSDVTGGKTVFTYELDSNMLVSAKNYDGMQVNMGYEGENAYDTACIDSYAKQIRRVIALEQVSGNLKGAKQLFNYQYQTTKVTAVENAESDAGKVLTYQFNNAGNVICCYDELGYAQSNLYSDGVANQQTGASRIHKAVVNLLRNSDFGEQWTTEKEFSTDVAAQDRTVYCLNMVPIKLTKAGAGELRHVQTIAIAEKGTYTFSSYVRVTSPFTAGGAFLRVRSGNSIWESRRVSGITAAFNTDSAADGWDRVFVTADLPAGDARMELVCNAPQGSVWFGCPQLERGSAANHFNLLLNSDFSRTFAQDGQTFANNWTVSSGISTNAANGVVAEAAAKLPQGIRGNAMRIHSYCNTSASSHVQTEWIVGKKNDTFVVGGWVNATSVASGSNHFKACIITRFYGTDKTWTAWQYNEYDPARTGWKFAQWAIVAPVDYTKMQVGIQYARNTGTAMFTNVFLYREKFGQSFAYDDKKNLISVADLSTQKSGMEYDDADNMKAYCQPGAASTVKYTMNYGSTTAERQKHLLKETATPMGQRDVFTHDGYGNVLTSTRQKSGDTAFIKTASTYTSNGNYKVATKDARGNVVEQTVNATDGTLTKVKDPNNQEVSYTYDAAKRVTGVQTAADGKTYKNSYTYEKDRIKTAAHNTTSDSANDVTYTLGYDALGRKTTVKVGSQVLSTNVYNENRSGLLKEVQYGNGGKVKYTYDAYDRLTGVKHDAETADRYTYEYDASGNTVFVRDNNLGRVLQTECDLTDHPMGTQLRKADGSLIYRTELDYDKQNRLVGFGEEVEGGTYKTSYTYDNDNRVTEIGFGGNDKVKYTYDNLGRVSSRVVENGTDAGKLTDSYEFVSGGHGTGSTTSMIAKLNRTILPFEYTYDTRGNIISEKRGTLTTTYVYDALGQLIRVNDPHENATWVYNYDRGGNITSKDKYAYTTGTVGTAIETIPYIYGDSNWKDKLTSYNGQTITYDAIGNPLNDGIWTYEWQAGRQLMRMSAEGTVVSFKYDHNGLRTQKVVEQSWYPVTTNYTYHGKLLSHMTIDYAGFDEVAHRDKLHFFYDSASCPVKVEFNGTMYTYLHNLQGDVAGIVDNAGNLVVEYKYDVWGKLLSVAGTLADTLGKRNPFCYRGYVCDVETGFYYVSSRYYAPELGRWINADSALGQIGNVQSANVFAYCFNNPVNMSDPTGNWPKLSTIFAVIAVVAVAVAAVAVTVATCGAAVSTLAVAGGSIIGGISAGTAATAASVATGAMIVAKVSTEAAVASAVAEKTVEKAAKRNNSVYVLKDNTGTVQYVGRTNNVDRRRLAHSANPARAGLRMEVIASELNLLEARALEQAGMAYYHTINTGNKMNNQINSVSPRYWGAFKELAYGTLNYGWNQMSNEILYWTGN